MKCPAPEQLAEAVTSEDATIVAHAEACPTCQAVLDDQRELRAMLQQLPDAPLTRARRETLAAEVLAQADWAPPARRGRIVPLLAVGLAVAAIVALIAYLPGRGASHEPVATAPPPPPPAPSAPPMPAPPAPAPVVIAPAPAPAPIAIGKAKLGGGGEFAREARGDRDVVKLAGGDLTVDAVGTRAVHVVTGDTEVGVKSARVKVIAKRGVIAQVSVFAGSAEVTVGGKKLVIEAGMTWDRNATREDSLAMFRTGWEALRAGNNAEAVAAFDQATDDVVAEDALYWGAVASERAHDDVGALTRYRALVQKFPKSPRVDAAITAIARLSP
jgi:hypothetical protein